MIKMVAGGMTAQQIVDELPPLEIEDVAMKGNEEIRDLGAGLEPVPG